MALVPVSNALAAVGSQAANPYIYNTARGAKFLYDFAPTAYRVGTNTYQVGKKTIRGISKLQSKFRSTRPTTKKRKGMAGQSIADRVMSDDSVPTNLCTGASTQSTPAMALIHPSELYSRKILFPQISSVNNAYNQRCGHTVHVSGIKLCHYFANYEPNTNWSLHVALVQPKRPITDTNLSDNFFRDHTSTTTRALDFPAPTAATNWDFRIDCYGINPDKFNVLFHNRYVLGSPTRRFFNGSTVEDNPTPNNEYRWMVRYDKYIKLNKRFTFDNPGDTDPINPIYVLAWYTTLNSATFPSDPTLVTAIEHHFNEQVFFKNLGAMK